MSSFPESNDAICTYTGRIIRPLDPDPEQIDILDIAHALSNQCRYTGHTSRYYSVAQHSVLVSEITDYDDALWGLLHDGTEAYISDIARPVKNAEGFGVIYREAEEKLTAAVAVRFNLPYDGVLPKSVKWADDVLLYTEMRDLMPGIIREAIPKNAEYLDMNLNECWSPQESKWRFLKRYKELTNG